MDIEKTYELITTILSRKGVPSEAIDPFEVVKEVENYRKFWKPDEIKVLLLAESHVHTVKQEYDIECKKCKELEKVIPPSYPSHFVRFVYCLGYGENELLKGEITQNQGGTWQFWEIFSACMAANEYDFGFEKVLKKGTCDCLERLKNKVALLNQMKERGIWLMDASILGLAKSGLGLKIAKQIIELSWENYVKEIITKSNPRSIIIIGQNVKACLTDHIKNLNIEFKTIDAPQAWVDRQTRLENLKQYQTIVAKKVKKS